MRLMTTSEVAAYLRLRERTVYDMAAKRLIPCTRVTGKLLFPRHLIDRWIEAHTDLPHNTPRPAPPIYAGSSDPLLEWALRESGSGLALLTSGSHGGLAKLAAGEASLAGIHIIDPESDTYNIRAVRRELPFPDVVVIHWARRRQGLLVARDNPLGLGGIEDLALRRPRIALRPDGAGSRLLFDLLIERAGLDWSNLEVLPNEARTETDLATMIADGEADCGLGIAAAAARLGLGFVPLGQDEQFDLVMRRRDYFEPPIQRLLAFARTDAFRRHAQALGGYELSSLGGVACNG